jgi:hypothetical protein
MISTTATPTRAAKVICLDCGLTARSPIVVANGAEGKDAVHGRCADRQACAMRQRRAANKQREAKTT